MSKNVKKYDIICTKNDTSTLKRCQSYTTSPREWHDVNSAKMLTEFWPRMRTVIGICSVPMTCEVNVKVNTWRLSRPRFWFVPFDECVKWYASERRRFRMKEMPANLGEWKWVNTPIFFTCYFNLSSTWTNKTFGHSCFAFLNEVVF